MTWPYCIYCGKYLGFYGLCQDCANKNLELKCPKCGHQMEAQEDLKFTCQEINLDFS